jgi:hypothetical protein
VNVIPVAWNAASSDKTSLTASSDKAETEEQSLDMLFYLKTVMLLVYLIFWAECMQANMLCTLENILVFELQSNQIIDCNLAIW